MCIWNISDWSPELCIKSFYEVIRHSIELRYSWPNIELPCCIFIHSWNKSSIDRIHHDEICECWNCCHCCCDSVHDSHSVRIVRHVCISWILQSSQNRLEKNCHFCECDDCILLLFCRWIYHSIRRVFQLEEFGNDDFRKVKFHKLFLIIIEGKRLFHSTFDSISEKFSDCLDYQRKHIELWKNLSCSDCIHILNGAVSLSHDEDSENWCHIFVVVNSDSFEYESDRENRHESRGLLHES